eukprot:124711-Pleurochrysis_carterae.AAC.1
MIPTKASQRGKGARERAVSTLWLSVSHVRTQMHHLAQVVRVSATQRKERGAMVKVMRRVWSSRTTSTESDGTGQM